MHQHTTGKQAHDLFIVNLPTPYAFLAILTGIHHVLTLPTLEIETQKGAREMSRERLLTRSIVLHTTTLQPFEWLVNSEIFARHWHHSRWMASTPNISTDKVFAAALMSR